MQSLRTLDTNVQRIADNLAVIREHHPELFEKDLQITEAHQFLRMFSDRREEFYHDKARPDEIDVFRILVNPDTAHWSVHNASSYQMSFDLLQPYHVEYYVNNSDYMSELGVIPAVLGLQLQDGDNLDYLSPWVRDLSEATLHRTHNHWLIIALAYPDLFRKILQNIETDLLSETGSLQISATLDTKINAQALSILYAISGFPYEIPGVWETLKNWKLDSSFRNTYFNFDWENLSRRETWMAIHTALCTAKCLGDSDGYLLSRKNVLETLSGGYRTECYYHYPHLSTLEEAKTLLLPLLEDGSSHCLAAIAIFIQANWKTLVVLGHPEYRRYGENFPEEAALNQRVEDINQMFRKYGLENHIRLVDSEILLLSEEMVRVKEHVDMDDDAVFPRNLRLFTGFTNRYVDGWGVHLLTGEDNNPYLLDHVRVRLQTE